MSGQPKKYKHPFYYVLFTSFLLSFPGLSHTTGIKDVFLSEDSTLTRLQRDTNKYLNGYNSNLSSNDKHLTPEESSDPRGDLQQAHVGKRCIKCDTGYIDGGSPSYNRRKTYNRYDDYPNEDSYNSRNGYYDRDRDNYSDSRNGYYDRDRDNYSDRDTYRYNDRDRNYDPYNQYSERGRYSDRNRYSDGYIGRDRYSDYGRYDPYDYERYDYNDKYGSDRDIGYDNRGYSNNRDDRYSNRPWNKNYRGSSGFDSTGRGYYFGSGRPDYGSTSGYGNYGTGGYANEWNYGGGSLGRDNQYNNRYGGYTGYRPASSRDPYVGYRTTSYLYGRPSSTTSKPIDSKGDNSNTHSPQEGSG